jgi:hypothetical protein
MTIDQGRRHHHRDCYRDQSARELAVEVRTAAGHGARALLKRMRETSFSHGVTGYYWPLWLRGAPWQTAHRRLRSLSATFTSVKIDPAFCAVRVWYEADPATQATAVGAWRLIGLHLVDRINLRHGVLATVQILNIVGGSLCGINAETVVPHKAAPSVRGPTVHSPWSRYSGGPSPCPTL